MFNENIQIVITCVSICKETFKNHTDDIIALLKSYSIKIDNIQKLGPCASDFYFKTNKKKISDIKIKLQSEKYNFSDICIQKNINRKKKIIACDMDMTVIDVETIDLIATKILNDPTMQDITEKTMMGKIKFKKSIVLRTKKLKGINLNKIQSLLPKIKYTPGVKIVIRTMNKFGNHSMLVSGGYDVIAKKVANEIGFHEVVSNRLEIKNKILTGELENNIIDKKGKLYFVKKKVLGLNLKKNDVLAVGDGDNDIDMIKYAGLGIAWRAYPEVKKHAVASIQNSFISILYFQGYKEEDFVR